MANSDKDIKITPNTGSANLPKIEFTGQDDATKTLSVANSGALSFDGDLTVTGNFVVSGTSTSVNTETVTVNDNIIVLNNNASSSPSENAGIEVERGDSTNTVLRWNESTDRWQFTNDGTNYHNIPLSTEYDNSTAVTLATVSGNYLSLSGQAITAGTVPLTLGGTGATSASAARTALSLGTGAVLDTAAIADGGTGLATADQIHTFVTGQTDTIAASTSGNAATVTTNANLTGDITSTGNATSIASGVIVNADVNASAAIAYSKLNLTGAVLNADLAGSIAYSKLNLTGAIVNADLASGVDASKLTTGTMPVARLGTGNVDTTHIANDAIDSDKIAAGEVGNAALAGSGLSASKLTIGTLPDARYDSGIASQVVKGAEQEFSVTIDKALAEDDVWCSLSNTDEQKFTSYHIGYVLTIGNEEVRVISKASDELSAPTNEAGDTINTGLKLTRGIRGTSAAAHNINTAMKPDKNRTIQITKTDASSSTEKAFIPEFSGADGNVASVTGLVPKAAIGDQAKYLRGDGTWQTLSGGGSTGTVTQIVAGTGLSGGTITTTGTIAVSGAQTGITTDYNAARVIGRDAHNNIDFTTDNEIHFKTNNETPVIKMKASGEVEATSLDISGDADIDGTLEADAITIGGTAIGSIYSPVAGHSSIATVGTIGTGVWQGTAIASGYIAADAITGAKIADDAIDSEHYTDGSIDTAHIADNQVTLAKMAGITRGSIIIGNASGDPAALAIGSNDYVLTSDGTDIAWEAASGGIASLAADTSPQLGGNLDVDGNDIVSTSNGPIDINPNGTGKVRINTTSTDGVKLDVRSDNNATVANFRNQTSSTNAAQTVIQLIAGTSGTAAAGLGAKLQFRQGDDGYAGYTAGSIYSSRVDNSNHHLYITPEGTGDLVLDGLKWPQADGSANQVLKTDGSAQLSWASGGASEITDLSNATTTASSVWLGSTPANATDYNTAVGIGALDSPNGTNGTKNVAIGQNAGTANTEGFKNVFIGFASGTANTDADHNVFVGSQSGKANTTGVRNIAIGSDSYDAADTENDNIAIGYAALGGAIAGGEKNVAIGNYSGDAITSADQNTLLGHYAGSGITTSNQNVAIGYDALKTLSTGSRSIAIGYEALKTNTGGLNIGIGWLSMANEGAGQNNVAIGDMTMQQTENANNNVVMGNFAGYGDSSGSPTDSGDGNTAIGHYAMQYWKQGDYNTCLGYEAYKGTSNTANGDKNISIGWTAGNNLTSGSGNVVIGAADVPSATGDDQLSISSGDGDVTWITGNSSGGINSKAEVVAVSSNTTLTLAQTGSYAYWTAGTLTLPASGTVGTQYTVINNTGGSATVAVNGSNCSMVAGFTSATNATTAIDDHELASFVCVTANTWIQVG